MRRRLLVTHFLRRLLDNDLISPQADRHQTLAVLFAGLLTAGTFLTVLVSIKYVFRPLQSRGWTLLVSLDDTFLWSGLSMIVMALVALGSWEALSLDARDTEILGPLPVPRRTLVGGQLVALGLFAAGFTVALNAVPSVLAPLVRVSRLPVSGRTVLDLIAAHGVVTTTAGLFGFVSVLGVREVLRAILGPFFPRVSATVQGGLVVVLATAFLLLPVASSDVERRWVPSRLATAVPPVWFVGLHESLAGEVLARTPPVRIPADAPARLALLAYEAKMTARYRDRQPLFSGLRDAALAALGIAVAFAGAACAWNNRRLPELTPIRVRRRSRLRTAAARLLQRTLVSAPLARAGFVFTLQTLTRSAPHRVALATTCGMAVAVAAVSAQGIDPAGPTGLAAPRAVFAMQTWVLVVLAAGFRYATRVPAHLGATATFVLSRSGDDRPFLEGVKRAGVVAVGCPAIALLVPAHLVLMGPRLAAAHAACGVLILLVLMELLFVQPRGLPFVSVYESAGNVLAAAPVVGLVAFGFVWSVATIERFLLADLQGAAALLAVLAAVWAGLWAWNRRTPTDPGILDPDAAPVGATQPFALND